MLKLKGKPRWEASKTIFWGLVWTIVVLWLCFYGGGNYFDELELVRHGISTPVYVGECVEEYVESDSQGSGMVETCAYSYTVNGRDYHGGGETIFATDTVVYLPGHPEIHRVKHTMGDGLLDFFFRRVLLGIVLLVMFIAPGIQLLRLGIIAFKKNELIRD